eukprot:s4057_g3.t1
MHFSESSFHWQVRASRPDKLAQGSAAGAVGAGAVGAVAATCQSKAKPNARALALGAMGAMEMPPGMSSELDPNKTHLSHSLLKTHLSWTAR